MQEKKFNQKEYINAYNKLKYSQFKVSLKIDEKNELDTLLKKKNLSKAKFLRNAIQQLKDDEMEKH